MSNFLELITVLHVREVPYSQEREREKERERHRESSLPRDDAKMYTYVHTHSCAIM
jgi:hypothetical protein